MVIVNYGIAAECKNREALYTCYMCRKCGRKFKHDIKDGIMVDDGGTTVDDEDKGGGTDE